MFKKIVWATDGSDSADNALAVLDNIERTFAAMPGRPTPRT